VLPAAAPVQGEDFMDTSKRSWKRQAAEARAAGAAAVRATRKKRPWETCAASLGSFRRRIWAGSGVL
jgi:hypothetical protein